MSSVSQVPPSAPACWVVRMGDERGRGPYLWCCRQLPNGRHVFDWRVDQQRAFRFTERGLAEAVAGTLGGRVVKLRLRG